MRNVFILLVDRSMQSLEILLIRYTLVATDLGLTGVQYNAALAIFFISYILFGTSTILLVPSTFSSLAVTGSDAITSEIPSNIILKQISRPSWYLGGLTVAYGIIMLCHGFIHHFSALAGCRFLLGVFE